MKTINRCLSQFDFYTHRDTSGKEVGDRCLSEESPGGEPGDILGHMSPSEHKGHLDQTTPRKTLLLVRSAKLLADLLRTRRLGVSGCALE